MNGRLRPKGIDLFCGAGGMSLGFEQAGFDIVCAVDADGHHAAVHQRNFPNHLTVCKSAIELTGAAIFEALGGRQEIDIVFGGPPCQGFSSMGLRDECDPRNTLVDHFVRLVVEIRPKAVVMENVPGLATGKTGAVLERVVARLERAGYRIAKPVRALDASKFGVPQKRKRLFLLGVRSDSGARPEYPIGPREGQPVLPTVWEAIGDLPDVDLNDRLFESDRTEYDRAPESDYAKVARGVIADPTDYSHPRTWDRERCTGCLRIRHMPKAVELYTATPPGRIVPGHRLPRLHPDGICSTLRAGSDSTHGSYTAPRPIHPLRPRCITAREAARLHGFPDWFDFYPTKWHAYRQIGNAVCPPVARAVGFSILHALAIEPSKPDTPIELKDAFELPEDRPRTLRRISHARNYPPVIAHLFNDSFDAKNNRLWREQFTYEDVQQSIVATGANLPWVRPETFVRELARSRNIRQILEPCLKYGYSIVPLEGRFIGAFRPADEPGTITERDTIDVRSGDVAAAVAVQTRERVDVEILSALAELFRERIVMETLWDTGTTVRLLKKPRGGSSHRIATYRVVDGEGAENEGMVALLTNGSLRTKSRLQRLMKPLDGTEVVVAFPVTGEHVLAIRYRSVAGLLREINRRVYRVELRRRQETLEIKIPDATPEIIARYAKGDEQALLAKVRYNRLIDVFLRVTAYSLQSHLRTTVPDVGQIETDELYVAVRNTGQQFIVPVQAKVGKDQLGIVQVEQDLALCRDAFPNLTPRPVAVQFMEDERGQGIAMFELTLQGDELKIVDEKHYRLVPASEIAKDDLDTMARMSD